MAPRTPSLRRGLSSPIHTAETRWHVIPEMPDLTAAERIVVYNWAGFAEFGMPTGLDRSMHGDAFVSWGRWVVQCPSCGSAHEASRDDRRFFCTNCANVEVGGKWIPVHWPRNIETIEHALGRRPRRQNRNWMVGEPVSQLHAENEAHSVRGR